MIWIRRPAVVASLALTLATACTPAPSPPPSTEAPPAAEPVQAQSATPPIRPEATPTPSEPNAPRSTPAPDEPTQNPVDTALALTGEGIFLVDAEDGSTTLLPFGLEMATVETAITQELGDPEAVVPGPECPGDPFISTTWSGGLTLNADGDTFVGWSVRPIPGSEVFTTLAGVGIGASRQDLEAAYTITVAESSIGTEFTAGALAGLLSDPGPDAEITDLWAGTVCIFR